LKHTDILGVKLTPLTYKKILSLIDAWIKKKRTKCISIAAVSSINGCLKNAQALAAFNNADIVTSDGMPLVFLLKRKGFKDCERIYGPDLMLKGLEISEKKGYRNYFYGSTTEVMKGLKKQLLKKYPRLKISGMSAPPFRKLSAKEEKIYIEQINRSKTDILWIALSSPKQDIWMYKNKDKIHSCVMLGVGAALPIHAGLLKQAPRWMMKIGLEWLFRLIVEPRRLWKRYLIGNTYFIYKILTSSIFRVNSGKKRRK